ncbi:MAG: cysteine hydrolase family protein [Candidatus Levyibacteriota bacterium]
MHDEFLNWLTSWKEKLSARTFSELGDPKNIAVISVDMVVGFCHTGPLASPQVHDTIPHVVEVFKNAYEHEVRNYLLLQDTHSQNAEEFNAYPPHCIQGTEESENIPELKALPFANLYQTFEKNALSPIYDTKINGWITDHPEVTTYIVVGDCTDLCVYNMAMNLRMSANAKNIKRKVIVVANAVATYDMSVTKATELGAMPHPEKLLHPLFLYHMALNGIEVIKEVNN